MYNNIILFLFFLAYTTPIILLGSIHPPFQSYPVSLNSSIVLALFKCNSSSNFTIHGLWNEHSDFCTTEPFNITSISPETIKNMNKYWYSCYENSSKFWEHEWSKHGTCFNQTQEQYFSQTLELYNTYKDHCNTTHSHNCIIPISS